MDCKQKALDHVRSDMIGEGNPNYKHGLSSHELFVTWKSMMSRCLNKNNRLYHRYGGRGIKVCHRWNDFRNFLEDMGERPKGKQLDRINNDGNYEPSNCRWVTPSENRSNRDDVTNITHDGETKNVTEWAKQYGIHPETLRSRLDAGIDFIRAVTMRKYAKRTKKEL